VRSTKILTQNGQNCNTDAKLFLKKKGIQIFPFVWQDFVAIWGILGTQLFLRQIYSVKKHSKAHKHKGILRGFLVF
jgi:hypothetical protein